MKNKPTFETMSDLTLEARNAALVSWLNDLTTVYEKTAAARDSLLATCERYSEMRCDYFDGIPVACPGILADGFACMACALRMAVASVKAGHDE